MAKKIPPVNGLSFTITQQDFNCVVAAHQTVLPQYVHQESALSLLFGLTCKVPCLSYPKIL